MAKLIETLTFLNTTRRTSGSQTIEPNEKCVMQLFFQKNNTGFIEWDIEALVHFKSIELSFDIDPKGNRTLTNYSGIDRLPQEALDLLERNGIDATQIRKTMK